MKSFKNLIFIIFLGVLFLGIIQDENHIFDFRPLKGTTQIIVKPELNLRSWFSGIYQDSTNQYFESSHSLHSFFVRLNNQISYSLFNETKAVRVESGKEQFLYDNGYIKSYLGDDFIGDSVFIEKARKLKFIQEELKKRNTDLIFIINQGKASFYPEFLPSKYEKENKKRSNYDACIDAFKDYKVNLLDFREYLSKIKDTSRYNIFPKLGVHWSGYAATITADTLIKYMERMKGINIPDYVYEKGEKTFLPKGTDDDILQAMNLMFEINSNELYYPKVKYKLFDSTHIKPNVLIIGDSFVWTWLNFYDYIPNLFSSKSAYWYYNMEVHWPLAAGQDPYSVASLNFEKEIDNRDYILLVFNESSLVNCGYGFIEQAYQSLMKK